jgi:low affinity Fe/Cu permease
MAALVILVWAVSGPLFHFSDTWQLVVNTGTSVVTFLIVFIIQYTQTRDTQAMHLKLDELPRAVEAARNRMISVEDQSDEELQVIKKEFQSMIEAAGAGSEEGGSKRFGGRYLSSRGGRPFEVIKSRKRLKGRGALVAPGVQ